MRIADHVATVTTETTTVRELAAELDAGEAAIVQARTMLVAHLREAGWTWAMIGHELGVSHQAARQRYGRKRGN